MTESEPIRYEVNPPVANQQLNELISRAWQVLDDRDFEPVLARSLIYICAFAGETLVGFVNVAWDGGVHAFLLDTTVHPNYQRCGIGTELVTRASTAAMLAECEVLHVDYDERLAPFFEACGFKATHAGSIRLKLFRSLA